MPRPYSHPSPTRAPILRGQRTAYHRPPPHPRGRNRVQRPVPPPPRSYRDEPPPFPAAALHPPRLDRAVIRGGPARPRQGLPQGCRAGAARCAGRGCGELGGDAAALLPGRARSARPARPAPREGPRPSPPPMAGPGAGDLPPQAGLLCRRRPALPEAVAVSASRCPAASQSIVISGPDSWHSLREARGRCSFWVPPCPFQAILYPAGKIKSKPLSLAFKAHHKLALICLPWLFQYSSQENPLLAPAVGPENVSKLLKGGIAEWLRPDTASRLPGVNPSSAP